MSARSQLADVVTAQGNYAGAVSRSLAFVLDAVVSAGLVAVGLGATSLVVQVVTGHSVHWSRANIAVAIIFVLWEFLYFGYSWAASGRTFGMAVLGVHVVRADGATPDPWRGGSTRAGISPQLPASRPWLPRHPGAAGAPRPARSHRRQRGHLCLGCTSRPAPLPRPRG